MIKQKRNIYFIALVLSILLSTNLYSQETSVDSNIVHFTQKDIPTLSQYDYQWISYQGKLSITSEEEKNVNAQFFFANCIDSIIYLNFHISGIELGRAVIFPDSMIFVNKMSKTYYYGPFTFLQKVFGIPVDFTFLQSTLNGKNLPTQEVNYTLYEDSIKTRLVADPLFIGKDSLESIQKITLDNSHNIQLMSYEIAALMDIIDIKYENYSDINTLPFFTTCKIENSLFEINCTLKNIKFNVPFNTNISIPKSFKFSEILF